MDPELELPAEYAKLVDAARDVRQRAYVPYSNYAVGAALLAEDGQIFTGCNVENASYPATICAERVAMTKAVSEGQRRFKAIAVVTATGGMPCGICRQFMNEFAPELMVIVADLERVNDIVSLATLFPASFNAQSLEE
ncbi:MAG: cytidine deaminase [Chloroflexi bacterium]|nr:cytidine deaminase [Chloroflexota bacterium]